MYASGNGTIDIVNALLAKKAKVNRTRKKYSSYAEAVDTLLLSNADIPEDTSGYTDNIKEIIKQENAKGFLESDQS